MSETNQYYIVPTKSYNVRNDKRLLIPYMEWHQIGFVDHNGNLIIKPQYDKFEGEIFNDQDVVMVGIKYLCVFGDRAYERYNCGLIDSKGNTIIDLKYKSITVSDDRQTFVLEDYENGFCVQNRNGNTIVPYKKFNFISGFSKNLARVRIQNPYNVTSKWGIINDKGEVVLPVEYDEIWNFYEKNKESTKVVKDGVEREIYFNTLMNQPSEIPPLP